MEFTMEVAYAEACRALGEALVAQRLLSKEIGRLEAKNTAMAAALSGQPEEPAESA